MAGRNGTQEWRHGWIPLTPAAALQKAKGSKTTAAKLRQRHGVKSGGKGPLTRDTVRGSRQTSIPDGRSESSPKRDATPAVGTRVVATQPGIDRETRGKVVGKTDAGMLRVEYEDRRGNKVVGTFNPSNTRAESSTPSAKTPAAAPHTLKPGETATVRGTDQYGQPTTMTGKVVSNGEQTIYKRGRTTGGEPVRAISVRREGSSGMERTDIVYVPDPNRGEQKRGAAADREARMAEESKLRRNADVVARTAPTPSSADLSDAAAIFRARNPGKPIAGNEREVSRIADDLWRAKRLRSEDTGNTDAQKTAERARIQAASKGPDRMARELLAQKRGEAPKSRSEQLRERAAAERAKLQGIADGAGVGRLGITDPQANRLSGRGLAQAHRNTDSSLRRYTETQNRANALEGKAIRQEGREKEAARTRLTRADVEGATHIVDQYGQAREVVRVNAKTVTVKTPYSWTETVPIDKIRRAVKATPEQIAAARRKAAAKK